MKLKSLVKIGLVSLGLAIGFSGCGGNNQMIHIKKLDDGSKKYYMYNITPKISTNKYRGYNIHDFTLGLSANNNIITLYMDHELSFTQGSGIPRHMYCPYCPSDSRNNPKDFSNKRWQHEQLWIGFEKLDITNLKALKHNSAWYKKTPILDWWTEAITTNYDKKGFINYVKTHNSIPVEVKAKTRNISFSVTGKDMKNMKKFVACLEDEKMCIDKKKK